MITYNTGVTGDEKMSAAVRHAADALRRDIKTACRESGLKGIDICLNTEEGISPECFTVTVKNGPDGLNGSNKVKTGSGMVVADTIDQETLVVSASDDLGMIYGIYYISRTFLGINDFWFWNEQIIIKKEGYEIPKDFIFRSKPYRVRFRGWFINDEVLFDGWREKCGENFPWEMAFEALLRCGGNMTVPGTDMNAHRYKRLAAEYGLWITHHHAEPLGAEMFARAYPELEASYSRYPELFRTLWEQAIDDQKDMKVIWNIGFRGQGDRPFWADDPSYATPEARGKLVSSLMSEQIRMIRQKDEKCICCTNLYGEIMELYRDGYLDIPQNVIRIRADNGYGKMVSRRQNNHNPRIPSLPEKDDRSANGIYYHASFYDLQAAAMMTMLPNSPEFVVNELNGVLDSGADDFWIINCSHIKPHSYYLDLIARMWRGEEVTKEFTADYCRRYFGMCTQNTPEGRYHKGYVSDLDKLSGGYKLSAPDKVSDHETIVERIAGLYEQWPKYSVKYGSAEDEHAGEQFPNHVSRILACAFIRSFNKNDPQNTGKTNELNWLTDADTLVEQAGWCLEKFEEGLDNYREYLDKCRCLQEDIENSDSVYGQEISDILGNNLTCQVQYLYYSYLGAFHICRAVNYGLTESDLTDAFYEAGLARKAFAEGYATMRSHEKGIWEDFYKNDCEADIRQSAFVAGGLMSYLRILGDGPHFYKWQRHFQKDAGGDRVHLLLRFKEHLSDEELWDIMNGSKQIESDMR